MKLNVKRIGEFLLNYALYIILLLILTTVSIIRPDFLKIDNILNILKQASTKGILALGCAGLIVLAGTDLSIGRVLGLSAAVTASLVQKVSYNSRYYQGMTEQLPLIVPLLGAIAIGVAFGAINGFGVSKLHLHAFIITLGTQLIAFGANCLYIEAQPSGTAQALSTFDRDFLNASAGNLIRVGELFLLGFAVLMIIGVPLFWTGISLLKNREDKRKLRKITFLASMAAVVALAVLLAVWFMTNASNLPPLETTEYGSVITQIWMTQTGTKIPKVVMYFLGLSIIMWVVWNKTRLGKNMFAVGGNTEAASVSGVNVARTIMLVYLVAGALYGIAAFLEAGRITSVGANTGINYELDAISACVIGGVSFTGGVGTIQGVVIGSIILQAINFSLYFLQVNPYMQYIIRGLIIILAVAIDVRKYLMKK